LPTPTAQAAKHGPTPDIHANGFGSNLWDLPHLLPTPTVNDSHNSVAAPSQLERNSLALPALLSLMPTPCSRDWKDSGENTDYEAIAAKARLAGVAALLPTPVAWDHKHHGPNMDWQKRADSHVQSAATTLMLMRQEGQQDWGKYEGAIARWAILTRLPPAATDERGLLPAFVEWMMGLPVDWVCGLELSRSGRLKMLGNGVVPQQALLALQILSETESP
jgi:DNA (cytosine-5)-methyltransferase 1